MEKTKYLAVLMLLVFGFKAFSQNANENYSETNDGQNEINEEYSEEKVREGWQVLTWEEDSSVYRFDVEIQEQNGNDKFYSTIMYLELKDNSASVKVSPPLKPGNYRYRFIPYNFFGLKDQDTEYEYFTIHASFQPEVRSVIVNENMTSTIYLDEINDGIITVSGRNLFPLPKTKDDVSFTEYFLQGRLKRNLRYTPEILSLDENGRNAEFYLDLQRLDVGSYYFIARDASGLESERSNRSQIQIKFKKLMDFDVSFGYAFPIVLFDDTLETYFNTSYFPLSTSAKVSFLPFKRGFGYFGLGLSGTYSWMGIEKENYTLDGNLITGHLDLIYQLPIRIIDKKLNQKRHFATLEAHGGLGGTYFCNYKFHFSHGIETEPLNSLNLSFLAGGAIQVYFLPRFFAEINVDYVQSFVSDMKFGMLVPSLGVGWQF